MTTDTQSLPAEEAAIPETPEEEKPERPMTALFSGIANPPGVGELIEGVVISSVAGRVYVDLHPFGTGIIYGREYINARDVIRKINPGDSIAAKIVDFENPDGYVELSLKEARQALIWNDAEAAIREKSVFELPVKDANKGGLILEWQGIAGFLPASQLKSEHYPRVPDGDKDK
ncbi:MAG: S1 RNA-binding domain-containing protein, partial [bacterium]|nr:S1 RNA-binding domain-containing protein [bacterium]